MKNIELKVPHSHSYELPHCMRGESLVRDNFVSPGNYTLTLEEEFFKDRERTVWSEHCRFNDDDASLQHALWLMDNQHLIPNEFKGQGKLLLFAGTIYRGWNHMSGISYGYTPHIWCGSEYCPDIVLEWGGYYSPRNIILVRATKSTLVSPTRHQIGLLIELASIVLVGSSELYFQKKIKQGGIEV